MIAKLSWYMTELLDTERGLMACVRQVSCILKAPCRQKRSNILGILSREDSLTVKNILLWLYQKDLEAKFNNPEAAHDTPSGGTGT